MKIAIVDDEEVYIDQVVENIDKQKEKFSYIFDIKKFMCGEEFLRHYANSGDVDIVFMDIEIGDVNGIEVVTKFRETNSDAIVIFVTNYDNYVSKATRIGAFQYLKKPVCERDFELDFTRAINQYVEKHTKYELKCESNTIILEHKDIFGIEVYKKKINIYLENDKIVEACRGSIENKEIQFRKLTFARCHRSYLINLSKIALINDDTIVLTNGLLLPMSRNYRKSIMDAFNRYMSGCKI